MMTVKIHERGLLVYLSKKEVRKSNLTPRAVNAVNGLIEKSLVEEDNGVYRVTPSGKEIASMLCQ